jgi:hypothetical protein
MLGTGLQTDELLEHNVRRHRSEGQNFTVGAVHDAAYDLDQFSCFTIRDEGEILQKCEGGTCGQSHDLGRYLDKFGCGISLEDCF